MLYKVMKFCVQKQRGRVSSSHCPEALPPQDEIDLCFFVVCYFLCVRVLLSGAFYYVPDLVCRVLFGVAFGAVTSVVPWHDHDVRILCEPPIHGPSFVRQKVA